MAHLFCYAIERKKVDEGLAQSEERFRRMVDNAADAFFAHDAEGRFVDVNKHACDSLGYTRENLLSLSIHDIEVTLPRETLEELWARLRSGPPGTVERESTGARTERPSPSRPAWLRSRPPGS